MGLPQSICIPTRAILVAFDGILYVTEISYLPSMSPKSYSRAAQELLNMGIIFQNGTHYFGTQFWVSLFWDSILGLNFEEIFKQHVCFKKCLKNRFLETISINFIQIPQTFFSFRPENSLNLYQPLFTALLSFPRPFDPEIHSISSSLFWLAILSNCQVRFCLGRGELRTNQPGCRIFWSICFWLVASSARYYLCSSSLAQSIWPLLSLQRIPQSNI